jgi:4-hydroxythreonine-4-phosphate dehydrogenase
MGEPAGIGTEVLLKAYDAMRSRDLDRAPPFFLIDDPVRLERLLRAARAEFGVVTISEPAQAEDAFLKGLPVLAGEGIDGDALAHVTPGQPSTATASSVTASIREAVRFCAEGSAGGVVTLPIQKSVLQDAGFGHPGHTEYLGALTEGLPLPKGFPRGPVMMLAAGNFRTVPVTVHTPLAEVPAAMAADRIVATALVVITALQRDFGLQRPRLAVAGLNPHAGEDGHLGREEIEIIGPAIEALRQQGAEIIGPLPADTMFHAEARSQYDAAIAMYHDQALVPIKTVAFHEAVNVTVGLPIIRTSPDHGTGLGIAGRNIARPDSTLAAILTAHGMAEARASYDAAQ